MQFFGLASIDEIVGQKVGVFLRGDDEDVTSIGAEVFLRDGKPFIDCIPLRPRKYVAPIPEDAVIASAGETNAPYKHAIFIRPESEAALLISTLLKSADISRN